MKAQVLAFLWTCDLEWTSRSSKLKSNCRVYLCITPYQVWNKKSSQVSWQMMMLSVYLMKSLQHTPLIITYTKKVSMSFNKPKGRANTQNFIQIDTEISEKNDSEVFDFSYKCDLEWRTRSFKLVSNVEFSGFYHLFKVCDQSHQQLLRLLKKLE